MCGHLQYAEVIQTYQRKDGCVNRWAAGGNTLQQKSRQFLREVWHVFCTTALEGMVIVSLT